jgi:hypothetical protein
MSDRGSVKEHSRSSGLRTDVEGLREAERRQADEYRAHDAPITEAYTRRDDLPRSASKLPKDGILSRLGPRVIVDSPADLHHSSHSAYQYPDDPYSLSSQSTRRDYVDSSTVPYVPASRSEKPRVTSLSSGLRLGPAHEVSSSRYGGKVALPPISLKL